jgi:hypothetical protein
MWAFFKRRTAMTIFDDLADLQKYLAQIIIDNVTFDEVKSICGTSFIKLFLRTVLMSNWYNCIFLGPTLPFAIGRTTA